MSLHIGQSPSSSSATVGVYVRWGCRCCCRCRGGARCSSGFRCGELKTAVVVFESLLTKVTFSDMCFCIRETSLVCDCESTTTLSPAWFCFDCNLGSCFRNESVVDNVFFLGHLGLCMANPFLFLKTLLQSQQNAFFWLSWFCSFCCPSVDGMVCYLIPIQNRQRSLVCTFSVCATNCSRLPLLERHGWPVKVNDFFNCWGRTLGQL